MMYAVLILVVLVVGVLILRIRVRLELSDDTRVLFVGLGRSGPEFDFAAQRGILKLFGIRIKAFSLEKKAKVEPSEIPDVEEIQKVAKKKRPKPDWRQVLEIVPKVATASFRYLARLVRGVIIEQAEGTIRAGFEEPDVTGQVYGYYQCLAGAIPGLAGHLTYVPVWDEPTFSGRARFTAALPLYRLAWATVRLLVDLPIRKLYRVFIGSKRGADNV